MGSLDERRVDRGLLAMQHNIDPRYKAAANSQVAGLLRRLAQSFTPQNIAQLGLEMLPGSGDYAAARDSAQMGQEMVDRLKSGDYGGAASSGLLSLVAGAGALPFIPYFGGMVRRVGDLPMDEASRMSRAKDLGYQDEPFYRGADTYPQEYQGGGHFSRDREYSAGFDPSGTPEEYRLQLERGAHDSLPMTGRDYADLIEAARRENGVDAALRLAEALADGISIRAPVNERDMTAMVAMLRSDGARDLPLQPGGLVRQAVEMTTGNDLAVFKSAGFDHYDSGRDVRKFEATGIRRSDAAFNPEKADLRNKLAAIAPWAAFAGLPMLSEDR